MLDVMVVEDFPLMREALVRGIDAEPELRVVAQAGTARELLDALVEQRCDVAIVDMHLPDVDGIELIQRIRRLHPGTRVLVLTASERSAVVRAALDAGASGYLVKRQALTDIVDAIRAVVGGGMVVAPQVAGSVFGATQLGQGGGRVRSDGYALDPFELDVLRLVVRGATDAEIAHELYVSPRTVQYQLAHIRQKAGVARRAELARWAFENSLV